MERVVPAAAATAAATRTAADVTGSAEQPIQADPLCYMPSIPMSEISLSYKDIEPVTLEKAGAVLTTFRGPTFAGERREATKRAEPATFRWRPSVIAEEVELTTFGQSLLATKRAETRRDDNTMVEVEPMTFGLLERRAVVWHLGKRAKTR